MRQVKFCLKGTINDNIMPNKFKGIFHKWITSKSIMTYALIEDTYGNLHTIKTDQFNFK